MLGVSDAMTVYRWELDADNPSFRRPRDEGTLFKLYRISAGEISSDSFYDWPALNQPELKLEAPPPAPLLDRVPAPELDHAA